MGSSQSLAAITAKSHQDSPRVAKPSPSLALGPNRASAVAFDDGGSRETPSAAMKRPLSSRSKPPRAGRGCRTACQPCSRLSSPTDAETSPFTTCSPEQLAALVCEGLPTLTAPLGPDFECKELPYPSGLQSCFPGRIDPISMKKMPDSGRRPLSSLFCLNRFGSPAHKDSP
jgi:hypothetical protein